MFWCKIIKILFRRPSIFSLLQTSSSQVGHKTADYVKRVVCGFAPEMKHLVCLIRKKSSVYFQSCSTDVRTCQRMWKNDQLFYGSALLGGNFTLCETAWAPFIQGLWVWPLTHWADIIGCCFSCVCNVCVAVLIWRGLFYMFTLQCLCFLVVN